MIVNVSQINGSLAVIIPPTMLQRLNIDKNSMVDIRLDNNFIQIMPIKKDNKQPIITQSVANVGGMLQHFTDKKLTVEQMNDGIAQRFKQLTKE